jgi:dihydrofolate reductase
VIVSLIAALDEANGIGFRGGLPWRLPADLRRFKRLTMGHHLICGRKSFQSIGRPLPGRTMIVVTRQQGYQAPGCEVVHSLEGALALAEERGEEEVFVIGGAALYAAALPQAHRLYLTRVHAVLPADVHFPNFDPGEWVSAEHVELPADQENPYATTFMRLERNVTEAS